MSGQRSNDGTMNLCDNLFWERRRIIYAKSLSDRNRRSVFSLLAVLFVLYYNKGRK